MIKWFKEWNTKRLERKAQKEDELIFKVVKEIDVLTDKVANTVVEGQRLLDAGFSVSDVREIYKGKMQLYGKQYVQIYRQVYYSPHLIEANAREDLKTAAVRASRIYGGELNKGLTEF